MKSLFAGSRYSIPGRIAAARDFPLPGPDLGQISRFEMDFPEVLNVHVSRILPYVNLVTVERSRDIELKTPR